MATLPSGAVALLHLNGTNGSTTIANDVSGGLAFVAAGVAALTTANKKFGTSGIDFSTGAGRIQSGTSVNLPGDFFIGGWGFRTGYTGKLFSIGSEDDAGSMNLEHFINTTTLMTETAGGGAIDDGGGACFGQPGDGWRMWMVSRSGTTLRLAVEDSGGNVQSIGTVTDSTTYTGTVTFGDKVLAGGTPEGGTCNFWMDELVVLAGDPVYTSFPFAAPAVEFSLPASGSAVTPAAGTSTVSTVVGASKAAGGASAAAGVAAASAAGSSNAKAIASSAAGVAAGSAAASAVARAAATPVAGAATVSASTGTGSGVAAVAAAGVATASAVGASKAAAAGQANGTATASAVGTSTFRSIASAAAGVAATGVTGAAVVAASAAAAAGAAVASVIASCIARASGLAEGVAAASATTNSAAPPVIGSLIGRTRQAFGIRSSVQTATRKNEQSSKR